jgi:hypothetical protein
MLKKKDDQLKLEIARELGLIEKIEAGGWKSLSPKETGRIGGLLSRKRKSQAI